ncbi:unnamed protein product [Periconia digitata]|uniref:Uncharacterized protein n=1 Tax=Periconia digitata TaxID=1303443 RepID=A0A9W4XRM4_9PLEO|nr:unnamed protein product [Periconia digitata]
MGVRRRQTPIARSGSPGQNQNDDQISIVACLTLPRHTGKNIRGNQEVGATHA